MGQEAGTVNRPDEVRLLKVAEEVVRECARAGGLHERWNSAHEGYAILLEEMDELKEEVWKKRSERDLVAMRTEAIQIGACAMRFVLDVCDGLGEEQAGARVYTRPKEAGMDLTKYEGHTQAPWYRWVLADNPDAEQYGEPNNGGKTIIVAGDDAETEVCGVVGKGVDALLIEDAPELLEEVVRLRERVSRMEADWKEAAGGLLVPIPEPGSNMSKLLSANVLMRRENEKLREGFRSAINRLETIHQSDRSFHLASDLDYLRGVLKGGA